MPCCESCVLARRQFKTHYDDVIMNEIASQITSLTIVYSIVYSDADQRKHQSSASLAFVRGIHQGLVNSPHKWPVTRKMFPFDDVIMPLNIIFEISAKFTCCCDNILLSNGGLWLKSKILNSWMIIKGFLTGMVRTDLGLWFAQEHLHPREYNIFSSGY